MPEYLAPGVYIEEVSFRSKSIEGVSTTTTGFIGPTRYGPVELAPELLTSLADFERTYGDRNQLDFEGSLRTNYMWQAARAFFAEGGQRLYVSRVFRPRSQGDDGVARAQLAGSVPQTVLKIEARWPGETGNFRVRIGLNVGQNVLSFEPRPQSPGSATMIDVPKVGALADFDIVLLRTGTGGGATTAFYRAERDEDTNTWTFTSPTASTLNLSDFQKSENRAVYVVTAFVAVAPASDIGALQVWDGLALDPSHTTNGADDSITRVFARRTDDPDHGRSLPIVISTDGPTAATGLDILEVLFAAQPGRAAGPSSPSVPSLQTEVTSATGSPARRFVEVLLSGGDDGKEPEATEYEGAAGATSTQKTGLKQFEDIDDISIVAAPGSTANYKSRTAIADTIVSLLIGHCQYMRYRIAVIDSGNGQTLNDVQAMRAKFDTSHAAFYYPWVRVLDPVTRVPIALPPSGFVAGIYARNDVTRAVFKAPANEVVNLSIGFEVLLNKAQQDVLNPQGINCFRYFEGRGYRLWGGRTMSSDPEWKYVNLRRYFAYLEHSIDKGTQWAVFEPNGPRLWNNVRQTIEDFLYNEFMMGALLGDKPEKSYFVRCDRSTMTQNDLDNGRLVCLIGVSPLRPAEFVIFRIGQWTADRK